MSHDLSAEFLQPCRALYDRLGYVPLEALLRAASQVVGKDGFDATARSLCEAFNASPLVRSRIAQALRQGDNAAHLLQEYMRGTGLDLGPLSELPKGRFKALEARLEANPYGFLSAAADTDFYPFATGGAGRGYPVAHVRRRLAQSRARFVRFKAGRRSDTAILVGNGPSLRQMDFSLFRGQDLFISNYAVRNEALRQAARGVAVSNPLVAEQEPHVFLLNRIWRFHPFWLEHTLQDSDQTIWLDAQGGEMFFSPDVQKRIAWHSTVTFFWLQILYSAGYRKVLLVGVDNSYVQRAGAREGDLIRQDGLDVNHFDTDYFVGKVWQAADTDRMSQTYELAKRAFEADGREIVNCGIGGELELFPRMPLQDALRMAQERVPGLEPRISEGQDHSGSPHAKPQGAVDAEQALLGMMSSRLMQNSDAAQAYLAAAPGLRHRIGAAYDGLAADDPYKRHYTRIATRLGLRPGNLCAISDGD